MIVMIGKVYHKHLILMPCPQGQVPNDNDMIYWVNNGGMHME